MTSSGATVFTIGHSTRSLEDFIEALKAHGVQCVVDVRRFPASRRYPHFNRDALGPEMARRGIDYVWLPELGGRRAPNPESRNTRWRNLSFRGYADYMETAPFHRRHGTRQRACGDAHDRAHVRRSRVVGVPSRDDR